MCDHIYERDGDNFVPTEWAGSPWSRTSQHGGPTNALMMRAAEQVAADVGKQVARLSVDILKPIPMVPLTLKVNVLRQGRRMTVIDILEVRADDASPIAVGRAVALKAEEALSTLFEAKMIDFRGPEAMQKWDLVSEERRETGPPGFHRSIQVRYGGSPARPMTWLSSPLDLVADELTTPAQHCAAICDLTTVISGRIELSPPGEWDNTNMFPMLNTDTILHLLRAPMGTWFGFSNNFIADQDGIGIAEVALHDEQGCIGRSVQTVVSNA